jgi:hypothetical protein
VCDGDYIENRFVHVHIPNMRMPTCPCSVYVCTSKLTITCVNLDARNDRISASSKPKSNVQAGHHYAIVVVPTDKLAFVGLKKGKHDRREGHCCWCEEPAKEPTGIGISTYSPVLGTNYGTDGLHIVHIPNST